MIFKRWEKATKSSDCYAHIQPITDTQQDAIDTMSYGLKTLNVASAKKYPAKFLKLIGTLHGQRTFSHTKEVRTTRAEINKEYKESRNSDQPNSD